MSVQVRNDGWGGDRRVYTLTESGELVEERSQAPIAMPIPGPGATRGELARRWHIDDPQESQPVSRLGDDYPGRVELVRISRWQRFLVWFRFRPAAWPLARLVRPRPPKDTMADPEAPTPPDPSASPVAQLNAITALHDFAAEMLRIRDAKISEMQVEMERLAAELAASKAAVVQRDQRIAELEARIAEG